MSLLGGYAPKLSQSFTILSGEDGIDGAFNDQVLVWDGSDYQTTFDGWNWFEVSYGNSVVLNAVPEPGTWLLLLLIAAPCGLLVRRLAALGVTARGERSRVSACRPAGQTAGRGKAGARAAN